MDLKLTNTK